MRTEISQLYSKHMLCNFLPYFIMLNFFCLACSDDSSAAKFDDFNAPPVAVAEASPKEGVIPFQVNFTGSKSSDNEGISSYRWNFKDGLFSDKANPSHTFKSSGSYKVELTVIDEEGLSSKDVINITANSVLNEAPIAVANVDSFEGEAPLVVTFNGTESFDDEGIKDFRWSFPNESIIDSITTVTFEAEGEYNITLTVTDGEGLEDSVSVTIMVWEKCDTNGGRANENGLKTWCWNDVIVSPGGPQGYEFSNNELSVNTECVTNQIANDGANLRFYINPTAPSPSSWCSNDYNFRAEISTVPWRVNHVIGTEEWFGWSLTMGDDYKIDRDNYWYFFQVHNGISGSSPLVFMQIVGGNVPNAADGQIRIGSSYGNSNDSVNTGFFPKAGQKIDIVVHVVWGDSQTGRLEVWINGDLYYEKQGVITVMPNHPHGGNAKWGIYKPNWRTAAGIESSKNQGINDMEVFMGPLRQITRFPEDDDYGTDGYDMVSPK